MKKISESVLREISWPEKFLFEWSETDMVNIVQCPEISFILVN